MDKSMSHQAFMEKLTDTAIPFKKFIGEVGIAYDGTYSAEHQKDYWKVVKTFAYYVGDPQDRNVVVIWKNTRTDGASVPRIFWSIVPPWGRYGPATIIHDKLCTGTKIHTPEGERACSRKEADQIFNNAMKVLNVDKWQRRLIYFAVRAYAIVYNIK